MQKIDLKIQDWNTFIEFLKEIKFENDELTKSSKKLIKIQSKNENFKKSFETSLWRNIINTQEIFNTKEVDVFLEHIISNYMNFFQVLQKIELYNIYIYSKVIKEEFKNAIKLISEVKNKFYKKNIYFVTTLNFEGNIYKMTRKPNKSLEVFYESLDILETLKNKKTDNLFFSINNNIGLVYKQQNELDKAEDIFEKNLKQQCIKKNKLNISVCFANLSGIYYSKKEFKKSIEYDLKAQKIRLELGHLKEVERINLNISSSYFELEKLVLAKKYISLSKESLNKEIIHFSKKLDLAIQLKQFQLLKKPTQANKELLSLKADEFLLSIEINENEEDKLNEYLLVAEAFQFSKNYKQAIKILNKRDKLYAEHIEEEKIATYQKLRESHELQLQQNEIEQKEKTNQKLQEINKGLEQFTYMASHDLKSPLRNISAFSSMIVNEDTSKEEITEYTKLIKSDAKKMTNLITSLLDYSKIGFSNVNMEQVDLNPLVKNLVKSLNKEIKQKSAIIILNDLAQVKGNTILLEQLFENLISNALKYNDKPIPKIEISSKQTKKELIISIKDNGIGIPENKINDIFKAFTRAHASAQFEGSGVGLATCKKIMEIHSGTISANSEVGKGTCFTFTFNLI